MIEIEVSKDGKTYKKIESASENFFSGKLDYQYWKPIQTKIANASDGYHYLKIKFLTPGQIGRVELTYGSY